MYCKWDTKILGVAKGHEKDKHFLESEMERRLRFHQIAPLQLLQSAIPTKIWKVFQTRHAIVENKLVMLKKVIEKWTKCKTKLGSSTNKTMLERIQPKVMNLS